MNAQCLWAAPSRDSMEMLSKRMDALEEDNQGVLAEVEALRKAVRLLSQRPPRAMREPRSVAGTHESPASTTDVTFADLALDTLTYAQRDRDDHDDHRIRTLGAAAAAAAAAEESAPSLGSGQGSTSYRKAQEKANAAILAPQNKSIADDEPSRVARSPWSPPSESEQLPPRDVVHRLMSSFFANRWPHMPFIDQRDFDLALADIDETIVPSTATMLGANDDQSRHISRFYLHMVCALGYLDEARTNPLLRSEARTLFRIAMSRYLPHAMRANDHRTIQALLLVTLFSMSEPDSVNLWHIAGLTMRMCIDHRMHLLDDPTLLPCNVNGSHILDCPPGLSRRIFWSVYNIDRSVSVTLGRPTTLSDHDITTQWPATESDDYKMRAADGSFEMKNLDSFVHTIRIRRINGMVCSGLTRVSDPWAQLDCHGPYVTTQKDSIMERRKWEKRRQDICERIHRWRREAPTYSERAAEQSTYLTQDWFDIAYNHSLLLLHRPHHQQDDKGPIDVTGLTTCASASLALLKAYLRLLARNRVTYTWVALHSAFLASITLLHALRNLPSLRTTYQRDLVEASIKAYASLFLAMSPYWGSADRCRIICERVGAEVLASYDKDVSSLIQDPSRTPTHGVLPPTSGAQVVKEQSPAYAPFTRMGPPPPEQHWSPTRPVSRGPASAVPWSPSHVHQSSNFPIAEGSRPNGRSRAISSAASYHDASAIGLMPPSPWPPAGNSISLADISEDLDQWLQSLNATHQLDGSLTRGAPTVSVCSPSVA